MNNVRLSKILKDYPVTVCAADQLRVTRGRFVITNTDTSDGAGKHWVTFYFPERQPIEYFDSLGKDPEYYEVGFEQKLRHPYRRMMSPIQANTSDTCGHYCIYYIAERFKGGTMEDVMSRFDVNRPDLNDDYVRRYVEEL